MPPTPDNSSPAPDASPPLKPESFDKESERLLEPGERMLMVIFRHPIGLVLIYLEALTAIIALALLVIFIAPNSVRDTSSEGNRLLIAGIVLAVAVVIFFLLIASYVYRQCRLIITDKSLVQVFQRSLFSRSTSRLSMSNVEDVTATENGILSNMFNYGTLMIQTAGEMDNFIFPTCPDPNKYAHEILEARQAYAKSLEEGNERWIAHH